MYKTNEGPRFVRGHAVSMGLIAMSAVIFIILWAWFRQQNKRREQGELDLIIEGMSEGEIEELGEHNPRYRYTY